MGIPVIHGWSGSRSVATTPTTLAHHHQGIGRSLVLPLKKTQLVPCRASVRHEHSDSGGLPHLPRHMSIASAPHLDRGESAESCPPAHHRFSTISSRVRQCLGRRSIKGSLSFGRVVSPEGGISTTSQEIWDSSDRPVCSPRQSSTLVIPVLGLSDHVGPSRCGSSPLEQVVTCRPTFTSGHTTAQQDSSQTILLPRPSYDNTLVANAAMVHTSRPTMSFTFTSWGGVPHTRLGPLQ